MPIKSHQPRKVRQLIQVGAHQIALPEGVTVTDWALERVHWQNPRIRAFLGCIRLLEGVLESNYSLLHCSPERLLDIWSKVRQVADLIRNRIAPLLRVRSSIPALEEARQSAEVSLRLLSGQVLDPLARFSAEIGPEHLNDVRKLLCVSIGQLTTSCRGASRRTSRRPSGCTRRSPACATIWSGCCSCARRT
jgi:hypothetical protein